MLGPNGSDMDDASLDEFLDTDSGEDSPASESEESTDEGVDESESQDETSAPEAVDTETVEPATPTSRWTESGDHCERCDTETQRLWTDDEMAVCRDCKEW